jgi:hypothetical protein
MAAASIAERQILSWSPRLMSASVPRRRLPPDGEVDINAGHQLSGSLLISAECSVKQTTRLDVLLAFKRDAGPESNRASSLQWPLIPISTNYRYTDSA